MMRKGHGGVGPTTAALLLAAILGSAGRPAGPAPIADEQTSFRVGGQQRESTRTAPVNSQQAAASLKATMAGGPGRARRGTNPLRQARRLLEEIGYIQSGRHWRRFRKLARRNRLAYQIMRMALEAVQRGSSSQFLVAREA